MVQVKYLALAAVSLFIIGGISYMKCRGNSNVVVINRSILMSDSEYFIPNTDRTTFSVNKTLWLHQFDIPRIYFYESKTENYLNIIAVKAKIAEMFNLSSVDNQIIYARKISVNSGNETQVTILPKIIIKPNKFYEINLKFPTMRNSFMYKGTHEIKEYEVTKSFFGSIGAVKFYQNNPKTYPPNISDVRPQLSQGVIQSLYFKIN